MPANKPQIKTIKDEDIIALIQLYPQLSIEKLANKLQISNSSLRAQLNVYRREGVVAREGAGEAGCRWRRGRVSLECVAWLVE